VVVEWLNIPKIYKKFEKFTKFLLTRGKSGCIIFVVILAGIFLLKNERRKTA
jgi:hypothetical protein